MVKRGSVLGVACMAICLLTGILSTVAGAATLPSVLPEASVAKPIVATITSSTTKLGSGLLELQSLTSVGTLRGNSTKLGALETIYSAVESVDDGQDCTGLSNDVSGQVTVKGTFHIRDYKNGSALATATILLLAPVHFECDTILVVVSGCVAGALAPENILTKTLTLNFTRTDSDNTIITVLNEANGANELCQLLAKEGSGATKLTSLVADQTLSLFEFEGSDSPMEVLVMPL